VIKIFLDISLTQEHKVQIMITLHNIV